MVLFDPFRGCTRSTIVYL